MQSMTEFKYQTGFANELADKWEKGSRDELRRIIRALPNKAQAAYISTYVAMLLGPEMGWVFLEWMNPNNA